MSGINRIKKLQKKIKQPILVFGEPNIAYFTRKTKLGGFLLVSKDQSWIVTKDRFIARETDIDHIVNPKQSYTSTVLSILRKNNFKRVGVSLNELPYAVHKKLSKKLKLIDSNTIQKMREIKDKEEIKNLEKACNIADRAMNTVSKAIKVGRTERQVRTKAMSAVLDSCDAQAFDFIVASGKNSLAIHINPMSKKIKKNEMIIVDLGVQVQGYNSDLTRTFCIKPDREKKVLYNIVREAQDTAFRALKQGKSCGVVYNSVLRYFKKKKVEKYWPYSLGHGVGLEVHESPSLSKDSKDKLSNNMCFTIEPGIHLPDIGGCRIEDTILIKGKRPVKLTKSKYRLEC